MRLFVVVLMLLLCGISNAQVNVFRAKEIGVDWNKTTHVIFPTAIKYFSSVDNYIVADNIDNVLSIKANEKNFEGKSSLSVATADGKFHTFSVLYKDNLDKTNYILEVDSLGVPEILKINSRNDIHLLFSSPVTYCDFGSEVLHAVPVDELQNIVRISAPGEFDFQTNVSIATADKGFYTFDIIYNDDEDTFTYYVGDNIPELPALLKQEDLTDMTKNDIVRGLDSKGRKIYNLGMEKDKVIFSIHNLFVRNDKLLFRMEMENLSNIKYDVDYIKFYIIDRKKGKKDASQELEVQPLFLDNFHPVVEGKSTNVFSVCFEKFTIPDNKYFIIEVNEKNGGRHISLQLTNNEIINAEAF